MFWEEEEANRGHEDVELCGSSGNGSWGLGVGVGGADGNKGRGVGIDQLTDVFSVFVGTFGLPLVSHGEPSKILNQGVT